MTEKIATKRVTAEYSAFQKIPQNFPRVCCVTMDSRNVLHWEISLQAAEGALAGKKAGP